MTRRILFHALWALGVLAVGAWFLHGQAPTDLIMRSAVTAAVNALPADPATQQALAAWAWMNLPANGQLLRLYQMNNGAPPTANAADAVNPTSVTIYWSPITTSPPSTVPPPAAAVPPQ